MSLPLSQIFKGSTAQAFRGLTNVLAKTKEHAAANEIEDINFLDARLFPDMHEMKWQVQMITEFAVRGAARMSGVATDDLPELPMEGETFDALLTRIEECATKVAEADDATIDRNAEMVIEMPIGPEQTMTLDGKAYVQSFYLPNLFFHVTTAYNLARMQGVPVGKRDYMGDVSSQFPIALCVARLREGRMSETTRLIIRQPDDWHVHLRDGVMLEAVAQHTARQFARAIVMPNLSPPVTTVAAADAYRDRSKAAAGDGFEPLMTCYLTDDIDPPRWSAGSRKECSQPASSIRPMRRPTPVTASPTSGISIPCSRQCNGSACRFSSTAK